MIPSLYGLILSTILFIIGITGIIIRRNLIFILLSLEIMIHASILAFIISGSVWNQIEGQIMCILSITYAAVEVSIGLILLLKLHKYYNSLDIDILSEMNG